MLSYIDVRHSNLLPPQLTVGEAWDLSPQYTTVEDLALVRDALAEFMSQSRIVHIPVERPEAPTQAGEDEMVTRKTMTISRFVLGAWPTLQRQEP